MYDYKIALTYKDILDGTAALAGNPVTEKKEKKTSLEEEFEAIDNKYKGTEEGGGLSLEKLEYTPLTDEEIAESAKSGLYQNYLSGLKNLDKSIASENASLSGQIAAAEEDFKNNEAKIDGYYAERKIAAEKDAIRRGLARSSVITGKIEEFDREKIGGKSALLEETQKKISELGAKISELENKKQEAADDYKGAYETELAKQIAKLKEERDEKMTEVIKYNNTVQEKEKKYADSQSKSSQSATSDTMAKEEKLAAAKKYYDSLSKQQALSEFLGNPAMKSQLGAYYSYMLNYLNNRK